jgi:uncharacterized OsmC-like protein
MTEHRQFTVTLERVRDYEFTARFDWSHTAPVVLDEPEPLGARKGPNASRLIGAAVGNCLSASLLFCLEKAKQQVSSLKTEVTGTTRRNERGRLRISRLDVRLTIDVVADQPERVKRCLELFEEYCVVTESVRKGIEVNVIVTDPDGRRLYEQTSNGA